MNTQPGYFSQQGSTSLPEMRLNPQSSVFKDQPLPTQLLKQHSNFKDLNDCSSLDIKGETT